MCQKHGTSLVVAQLVLVLTAATAHAGVAKLFWLQSSGAPVTVKATGLASIETVFTGTPGIPPDQGFVVDAPGGRIFWAQTDSTIHRVNFNSCCEATVINLGNSRRAAGLAFDANSQKLYWTQDDAKVRRCNADGSQAEDLVVSTATPFPICPIVLDASHGKMYWVETTFSPPNSTAYFIRRANLEIPLGETPATRSDIETVLDTGIAIMGVAIDSAAGKLYFTENSGEIAGTNRIRRCDIDGSNLQTLFSAAPEIVFPKAIVLDVPGGKAYWTQGGGSTPARIRRGNMDGSGTIEDVLPLAQSTSWLGSVLESPAAVAGDLNGDGLVNGRDIPVFVARILCGC